MITGENLKTPPPGAGEVERRGTFSYDPLSPSRERSSRAIKPDTFGNAQHLARDPEITLGRTLKPCGTRLKLQEVRVYKLLTSLLSLRSPPSFACRLDVFN